ncbi:hypothetical protein ABTD96_20095, partial [Acinetobacter baumannii]
MTDASIAPKAVLSEGQRGWLIAAAVLVALVGGLTFATMKGLIGPADWSYKILVDPFVTMWGLPDLFIQT